METYVSEEVKKASCIGCSPSWLLRIQQLPTERYIPDILPQLSQVEQQRLLTIIRIDDHSDSHATIQYISIEEEDSQYLRWIAVNIFTKGFSLFGTLRSLPWRCWCELGTCAIFMKILNISEND